MKTVRTLKLGRSAAVLGLVGAVAAGLAPEAAAQAPNAPQFSVVDLGSLRSQNSLTFNDSRAFGLNNNGDVTGEAHDDSNTLRAFAWRNGERENLGTLGGVGAQSTGFGINQSGEIAGRTQDGSGLNRAFRFTGGLMLDQGTLGGQNSAGFGINAAGNIAGAADDAQDRPQAVIFVPGGPQPLGDLGGHRSQAFAINGSGHAVGEAALAGGRTVPFFFDGGQMLRMPTLGGPRGRLFAINDAGLMVGEAMRGNGKFHAYLINGAAVLDLGTLGGLESRAYGINASGAVVGTSQTLNSGALNAFLWNPVNGMQNLNNLIPFNAGWVLQEARAINDRGMIAGFGINPQGFTRGFLLVPQVLTSFTVQPITVPGSLSVTGRVRLNAAAAVDLPVSIRFAPNFQDGSVQFPQTVVIPRGSNSAQFTITTQAVTQAKTIPLRASLSGVELANTLTVRPIAVGSIRVSPGSIAGTRTATGTVTLEAPAGPGPINVRITSSNPALAWVNSSNPNQPLDLTLNAGERTATFNVATRSVSQSTPVVLTAEANGIRRSITIRVRPPQVSRLNLVRTTVAGGADPVGATAFLEAPAPPGGVRVVIGINSSLFATAVDAGGNAILSIVIPEGRTNGQFFVEPRVVTADTSVRVSIGANGNIVSRTLAITKARLRNIFMRTNPVITTQSGTLRVSLDGPAPADMSVRLFSDDSLAQVPGRVTIRRGRTFVDVVVKTGFTVFTHEVRLSATLEGVERLTFLTVQALGGAD